jgi:two-component system sensor histidine kinase KdpD
MAEHRPDPDQLLVRLQADEARARRGKLKIFFGASAGVGKTYAMLGDARQQQLLGIDVVIGVLETHGRAETEAMAEGLERLPLHDLSYRDRRLPEFDLDGALARQPAIILIDELAHSNVAGSRHPKRWQDVEELLAAGIDVYSTVNVQHMETLNDIVSGITGVRVWETVPDRIFDEADEVVVVDLPPDELIERLRQGKVYMPQQAEQAAKNFFRKGNLLALRELALRRTADRVDGEMQAYRGHSAVAAVWPNRGALLACVGANEQSEKIVRSCARLAAQLGVSWHAVHVEPLAGAARGERQRQSVLRVLKLAQDLGATTATLTAPERAATLVRYAREHNLSRLLMGRSSRRRIWPWRRSLGDAIEAEADDLEILRIALPTERPGPAENPETPVIRPPRQWAGYGAALALCTLTGLLATPLLDVLELSNIVMLFLLTVVGVALFYGRGPAVFAAFVGVALFDFFFVPPRFSFAVSDVQYLLTFAVMLVVALVVGQLTAGLKVQAASAMERERRVRGLYEMSRDLSAALLVEQVAEIGARFLTVEFGVKSAVLVADEQNELRTMPGASTEVDRGVAQWAFDRGEAAGRGTDTLPASKCLVLPLKATMRLRGVLAIELAGQGLLPSEQRRLLDTCASLMAISIERIHYIDVAQHSTLQMESERLRNSLLSAISHDLRTPLASLIGLADTVQLTRPPPTGEQLELIQAMRHSALRMNAQVNNLLDMARLEAGSVQLNRQWQPLEEVVGSALAACATVLAGRPIRVELAADLPLLHLDAVLIERVLVNLLENASKYTPALSPIEIEAHGDGEQVIVTLSDHGPGLPPGREEAIFEKFERGRKEGTTPGVGLGLAICRAIMHAHGGSIRGETGRTAGARFVLTLPRGEPPSDDGGMLAGNANAPALETESRT